jgi:hypothetical protein
MIHMKKLSTRLLLLVGTVIHSMHLSSVTVHEDFLQSTDLLIVIVEHLAPVNATKAQNIISVTCTFLCNISHMVHVSVVFCQKPA